MNEMNKSTSQSPATKTVTSVQSGLLQRACACGQRTNGGGCSTCEKERLQRSARNSRLETQSSDIAPPIVGEVLRSPGRPLDVATRAFFEPRFDYDFSRVRIHNDDQAAASARSVNALAYTIGRDVVFGSEYHPQTPDGLQLLAHELSHVVQQGNTAATIQGHYRVGPASDSYEREADRAAAELVKGNRAPHIATSTGAGLQRAMICSKRLEAPGLGLLANHAYIDDTGGNDCMGSRMPGNYAVQRLVSGNFLRGCAAKTDTSSDPGAYTPNKKPCEPKPGVSSVSACLRAAYSSYANPSVYSNVALAAGAAVGGVVGGAAGQALGGIIGGVAGALGGAYGGARLASGGAINSNTFAGTLARACCVDSTSNGLGWVPGWTHAPADPCT